MPGRVLKGTITVPKGGGAPTFSGDFATAQHPDGINAKDLDKQENAKDRQELLKLLDDEKALFSQNAGIIRSAGAAFANYGNNLSWIPVTVTVRVPERVVAGRPATFTATATTPYGPTRIEYVGWDFGNGTGARGATVEALFTRPGRYRLTVQATSAAGARGVATRLVVVVPASGAERRPP